MESSSRLFSEFLQRSLHISPALAAVLSLIVGVGLGVAAIPLIPGFGSYLERKVAADIQQRIGPNRAGFLPFGIMQVLADGIKTLQKEDLIPAKADRFLFRAAPYVCIVGVFSCFAAIPFSEYWYPADLNIGVYYILCVSSLMAVGIVLAGWASNNKWTLLGGIRSAGQMVSYEIPIAVSVVTVAMHFGSLDLAEITAAQKNGWAVAFWNTNPFITLSFVVYWIAALAECNRTPFDLPEAESELVAGYFTEYSGLRFSFFAIAEYAEMFVVSAMAVILYFGGFTLPFEGSLSVLKGLPGGGLATLHFAVFLVKVWFMIFLMIWIRWTLPRYRIDQLMDLCWKGLLPLAFLNFLGSACWMALIG
ncbi:MAG: NADH-quinone oxidoreductase subunit NuoH [Deltaproteobacteria bacterium]|nr:NADH-quinone oxidoreductase subunit NuoH [Deltaproteobacteria bacterium]